MVDVTGCECEHGRTVDLELHTGIDMDMDMEMDVDMDMDMEMNTDIHVPKRLADWKHLYRYSAEFNVNSDGSSDVQK